jgi:hypothetical protein
MDLECSPRPIYTSCPSAHLIPFLSPNGPKPFSDRAAHGAHNHRSCGLPAGPTEQNRLPARFVAPESDGSAWDFGHAPPPLHQTVTIPEDPNLEGRPQIIRKPNDRVSGPKWTQ